MNTQVEAPANADAVSDEYADAEAAKCRTELDAQADKQQQLHAHVETSSTDCDGQISRDYVVRFNADERVEATQEVNDFSEIHFMERVMASVASPYAAHQMTVTVNALGIEVDEVTEEGGRWAHARWCTDECEDDSSYRDHRAEAAGY